uniref:Ig-like domain-containing protein n=1 Tax=Electrophorus electricus TaxID=8005 RepID=A0AAY5EBL0_ELEEL
VKGQSVTLECSYYSTNQYVLLYWYRQYPNKKPQYLLRKPARSSTLAEHRSDPRFSSATSYTSTQLTISGLTLADTALYYCALVTPGKKGSGGIVVKHHKKIFEQTYFCMTCLLFEINCFIEIKGCKSKEISQIITLTRPLIMFTITLLCVWLSQGEFRLNCLNYTNFISVSVEY